MSALLRQFTRRSAGLCVLRAAQKDFPKKAIVLSRFLSDKKGADDDVGFDAKKTREQVLQEVKPEMQKSVYDKLVNSNKVVVFMKGTPRSPRCGFSNAIVQIFRMHGVEYDAHDVLADEEVREGIKKYTDWPTIPQVFIKGEFVGGCDILLEMHQSGDLIEKLEKAGIVSQLVRTQMDATEKESKAQKEKNKSKGIRTNKH